MMRLWPDRLLDFFVRIRLALRAILFNMKDHYLVVRIEALFSFSIKCLQRLRAPNLRRLHSYQRLQRLKWLLIGILILTRFVILFSWKLPHRGLKLIMVVTFPNFIGQDLVRFLMNQLPLFPEDIGSRLQNLRLEW